MKRVEYDITKSEYISNINKFIFYFSSKFNKNRFEDGWREFIDEETYKLKAKYHVDLEIDNYLTIVFYKKIEKRGFKVLTYDKNNDIIELPKDYIFKIE